MKNDNNIDYLEIFKEIHHKVDEAEDKAIIDYYQMPDKYKEGYLDGLTLARSIIEDVNKSYKELNYDTSYK